MTVIAATLLCDRKVDDQLHAVPAILALTGLTRLYVNIQSDGSADFAPVRDYLANSPVANHIETWNRSGWEGWAPEYDTDQKRLCAIVTARNMAIDYALCQGSEWLLFIDADVVPEPGGLRELLRLNKPLCGGHVPGRGDHLALHYVFPGEMAVPEWSLPVSEQDGVIRCAFGTCGYMLIHYTIFSNLRFRFNPLSRPGCPAIAEDPAFCYDAIRLGLTDAYYISRRAPAQHG